jgi:hypothetical protein
VLRRIPARNPVVLTPAEARTTYGYDKPAEAHLRWREKQHRRVFTDGTQPSDQGLIESQPILGSLS